MSKDRWEKERDCVRRLAGLLVQDVSGGVLGEALERLLEATQASAAAGFVRGERGFELVAERGFPSPPRAVSPAPARPGDRTPAAESKSLPLPEWHKPLAKAAEVAASRRRPFSTADALNEPLLGDQRGELEFHGYRTLVAAAARYQRDVRAALVLVGRNGSLLEPDALALLETVAHLVALALERDHRVEQENAYRAHLLEAGQMASLGLLTATVAQELRGPIGAMAVHLEEQARLVRELRSVGTSLPMRLRVDLQELTNDMKASSAQIASTLDRLKGLGRRETAPERIDLGDVAREALLIARGELSRGEIPREITLDEDLVTGCVVNGRRDGLRQVIINLLLRAADIGEKKGSPELCVTVRTRLEGNRVVLSVDDMGLGVPPQRIESLFQGFVSGGDDLQMHALPLRIAHDVVTAHHGHIEVVNLPEGGASLRVILPRATVANSATQGDRPNEGHETVELSPSQRSLPPHMIRRVFVVDDDELFTRTMKRALRPHDVRTAGTASEAELALCDPAYTPQMVLCDLGLPGLGGDLLHARIREKRPDIAARFVFVTGGACTKEEADYLRASGCPTLLKPLDVRDILRALRDSQPPKSVGSDAVSTLRPEDEETLPPRAEEPADERRASEAPTLPPPQGRVESSPPA